MDRRAALLGLLAAGSLSGCAALTKDVSSITNAINLSEAEASQLYAITKGIAEVAELANPSLAAPIAAGITAMDAVMALLQAGTATATDIAALVTRSASVIIAAAPAITVIANAAVAAAAANPG